MKIGDNVRVRKGRRKKRDLSAEIILFCFKESKRKSPLDSLYDRVLIENFVRFQLFAFVFTLAARLAVFG